MLYAVILTVIILISFVIILIKRKDNMNLEKLEKLSEITDEERERDLERIKFLKSYIQNLNEGLTLKTIHEWKYKKEISDVLNEIEDLEAKYDVNSN